MEQFFVFFMIALCGASPIFKARSNRISNALTAEENQVPYMISLQRLSEIQSPTRGHRCGGALISYGHVLSAATCTFDENNGIFSPINPAEYRVFAGSVILTNDTSADRHRRISLISVHPSWESSRPYNVDVAVIALISPFPVNVVKPVGLWGGVIDPSFAEPCTVAGWGAQQATASLSIQLMYLPKTTYNRERCNTLYNNINQINITANMICATSAQTASSGCEGDIGNPLVCYSGSSNNNWLAGILSITKGCSDFENPEVYARVSSFYGWIMVAMTYPPPDPDAPGGGASAFQPGLAMLAILALIQIYH